MLIVCARLDLHGLSSYAPARQWCIQNITQDTHGCETGLVNNNNFF